LPVPAKFDRPAGLNKRLSAVFRKCLVFSTCLRNVKLLNIRFFSLAADLNICSKRGTVLLKQRQDADSANNQ
jgi:hypothetical protein